MATNDDIRNQEQLNDRVNEYRSLVQEIAQEMGKNRSNAAAANAEYRKLDSIAQKLQDKTGKISNNTSDELKSLGRKARLAIKEIQNNALILKYKQQLGDLSEESIRDLESQGKIGEKDAALLRAKLNDLAIERGILAEVGQEVNQRLKYEEHTRQNLGLTGGLLKGISGVMKTLGMDSGIVGDAIKSAQSEMQKLSDEAFQAGTNVSRMAILSKGLGTLFSKLSSQFISIEVVGAALTKSFLALDKSSTRLVRLTGQNNAFQASINSRLATGADILENMAEFTERTGLAASAVFSSSDLARMAEAKNMLGLSSQEANNLGTYAKVSGDSIQSYQEGIVESVNSYNAANNAAVAHGVVLKDVLNTSSDIAMSLGGNPAKIAGAAAAARKLGLDLQKVDQIAGSLMNFESSIEAELEAQLLTGRQINMAKARELALNNDLEGLAGEISKQIGSAAEFANMNRIEQEALAKSLGMNREELAKTLIAQAQQGDLTDEQRAKMRGVTVEQLQQMEATESLQKAFSKLAEPIASILTSLTPIVNILAKVVAFVAPIAGPLWMAAAAMKAFGMNTQLAAVKTFALGVAEKGLNAIKTVGNAIRGAGIALMNSEFVQKTKNAVATKASAAAEFMMNGARQVGIALQNTAIGRWIVEKAQIVASTVAKWANIGATSAQATANASLAASQTAVASTGAAAGGGLAAAGAGLGAFGAAAAPAIPVILAIGAALLMAAPMMYATAMMVEGLANAIGNVLVAAIQAIPGIISSIANGFTQVFSTVGQNLPAFLLMGPALMGIAAGLSMLGPAGIMALPGIAALGALAAMATPLAALGSLFGGETGGSDNSGVEEKLDAILAAIQAGGNVYIDGNQVGQALVLGSYKSS